jgi:YggT family protein
VLIVLSILNGLLIAYLVLLSLRIALSWFAGRDFGRPGQWLHAATEPWLALFRRIGFLRRGALDLSPIAALLVIVVALDLVSALLLHGRITLGFALAAVLSAAWSGVRFLLVLFLVLGLLRTVPLLFRGARSAAGFLKAVDLLLMPVVAFVVRRVLGGRRGSPTQFLLLTLGLLFVALLLGEIVVRRVASLLQSLPV